MAKNNLKLEVVTQEQKLLEADEVEQISVPTTTGEITVLPKHIGLLTKLQEGVLTYWQKSKPNYIALFGGLMDVSPQGVVTVLADAAVRAEDIDIAKAEQAKKQAENRLKEKVTEHEFAIAEASLRQAYLELKAARIHQGSHHRAPKTPKPLS